MNIRTGGAKVIFVPGSGTNGREFDGVCNELKGTGVSSDVFVLSDNHLSRTDPRVSDYAKALAQQIQDEGKPVFLFGASLGSMVVQETVKLLEDRSYLIAGIVLSNPPLMNIRDYNETALKAEYQGLYQRGNVPPDGIIDAENVGKDPGLVARLERNIFGRRGRDSTFDEDQPAMTEAEFLRQERAISSYGASQRMPGPAPSKLDELATVLRDTRIPVMVMTGRKDLFISPPEALASMAQRLKDSKAVLVEEKVIEGAGHIMTVEKPRAVAQAFCAFTEKVVSQKPVQRVYSAQSLRP